MRPLRTLERARDAVASGDLRASIPHLKWSVENGVERLAVGDLNVDDLAAYADWIRGVACEVVVKPGTRAARVLATP